MSPVYLLPLRRTLQNTERETGASKREAERKRGNSRDAEEVQSQDSKPPLSAPGLEPQPGLCARDLGPAHLQCFIPSQVGRGAQVERERGRTRAPWQVSRDQLCAGAGC